MRIILANPRGFCAGVNMAIESLDQALQLYGTPLYVFHEIVHNRHVVERFRTRGAVFVDTVDEIPEGATVRILRVEGLKLYVEPAEAAVSATK